MNSLKQILLLILFFWAISIFAQQEHKESQNTVDYRSIEESLRKVDGKLTDLLKRIEIHNKRKKVHQSNDYKQTLEKKEIHLPTLPEKRNISLDEVKQDFKKVEAKIGGFSNRKNTNLTERKKYDSYLKE